MKKNTTSLAIAILIVSIPILSYAIKPPFKFGKVDKDELKMKSWNGDTTIPAVILYDYGYFNGTDYTFTRTTRIKILRKEGLKYGNKKILTNYKSNIRAKVFNLENGKVVDEKLKNSDIYREELSESGPFLLNFALQNVRVGSIIDIEYSHRWIPSSWYFQQEIPVQWSELIMEPTAYIEFRKKFYGMENLNIIEDIRWVAEDVPSFKQEPYINSYENYISKVEFDILKIHAPNLIESFTTNWEDFSDFIWDHDYLGDELAGSSFLRQTAKEIENKHQTDIEKIEAAFNAAKQVKWNGWHSHRIYSREIKFPWNNKIGNSAEVNMILYELLKRLNIECQPVVLSTRDNGMISVSYPSFNRINHVIVYAKAGQESFLLDATDNYAPYDLLTKKCLNYQGRTVNREHSTWVSLEPDKHFKELAYYNLSLAVDGKIKGQLSYLFEDYAALDFRHNYASFNSMESYMKNFCSDKPGLKVLDSEIKNIDNLTNSVEFVCDVEMYDNIDILGDEILIFPLLYERELENPFKLDDRNYPVDFAYKTEKRVIVNLTIAENMEFAELPDPTHIYLPDNTGYISFRHQVSGNNLNVNYSHQINKTIFNIDEYPYLKEFWNQIVNISAQPVIVKIH